MDRTEARILWQEAAAQQSAEDRSQLLRRLLKASVNDVLAFARKGRRRFDIDHPNAAPAAAYLFARSRRKNTLLDVVEVRVAKARHRVKTWSIKSYSELTLWRVPKYRLLAEFRATGNSDGIWLGKGATLGPVGSGHFIPAFERDIPRRESYGSFGKQCIWTAEQACAVFDSWLAQRDPQHQERRSDSIVSFLGRGGVEFSDEAVAGLRDREMPRLLDDLRDSDPAIKCRAFRALCELGHQGDQLVEVGLALRDSTDAAIRREALRTLFYHTNDCHIAEDGLLRGLSDADREVRWSACCSLESYLSRFAPGYTEALVQSAAKLLRMETDDEILNRVTHWFFNLLPARAVGRATLLALARADNRPQLRGMSIRKLGRLGIRHQELARTVLNAFDEFPIEATDALIDLKVFSPRARSKVSKLFSDPDWSKRWRAVIFAGRCPTVSKAMAHAVKELLDDEEFTIRTEARRVVRRLKWQGVL